MTPIQQFQDRLGKSARRVTRPRRADAPPVRRRERSGGSQDRALYTCGCGYAFTAAVSTSVGCPHCGTHQAW